MKNSKDDTFAARQNAAAVAKATLVEAHRAASIAAEPSRVERKEERLALSTARAEREAERPQLKHDEVKLAQAAADTQRETKEAATTAEAETQLTL